MRILLVVDIAYEAGGAEKSVRLIRDGLRRQGHKVCILSTDKNAADHDVFADELVPAISGPAALRMARHFWYPAAYRRVKTVIRNFRPDLIHLHTIGEFSPALLWGLGRTPAVLTVHGPEEFTRELLPWLLPASDYRGHSYIWRDIRLTGRLRYNYYRVLQGPAWRLALRRVQLVMAPSQFMAAALSKNFAGTPIKQIYNGIELLPASPLPASKTILFVGRLEAVKGVSHLLKAFVRVRSAEPKAKLRIVGDGDQRRELEALAKSLDLEHSVEFAGWIPAQRVGSEFKAAQILAIPSVWPENLPTVAIEALSAGRPIVGSRTGGISELVSNQNGYLVEPGNENQLAEALSRLLVSPSQLKRAAAASVEASHRFDVSIFLAQLLSVYKGAIDENTIG